MPASPLTHTRAINEFKWLFPEAKFTLKLTPDGRYAAWRMGEMEASYVGNSWEEVMRGAVMEAWKEKK